MSAFSPGKWIWLPVGLAGLWLAVKYVFPVAAPFLVGLVLALAAEPLVRLGTRLRLRRAWSAGVGVSVTLSLFAALVSVAGALAVRELVMLAEDMPDIQVTAREGAGRLEQWLMDMAQKTPKGVRPLLQRTVENTFEDGTQVFEQVTDRLPQVLTQMVTWIPRGTLSVFTALLSAFLISARLPKLKAWITGAIPQSWKDRWLPVLRRMRSALWGWLKAQLKLSVVTWGILSVGFLLLDVPYGPLWAALIALVDAAPVLGTGTVLIPWAVISFLQGQTGQGVGLLSLYGVALVVRTVLEPKFLGKQLGIDPLLTLAAFYAGFTFFGVGGMILAPVMTAAVSAAVRK